MIDIHAHFLPAIDDGAKDVNESIRMLTDAYKQGVTMCVGTSHAFLHGNGSVNAFLDKRDSSIGLIESVLKSKKISVPRMLYGAEVYLDNDITGYGDFKKLCISGTNLLLVELPTNKYNTEYSEWLYSISLHGVVPILAHIERYPYFSELEPELDSFNIIYQTNSKTVLNSGWRKNIAEMCDGGKCMVVSSDMHNMGLRSSCMKKAYERMKHFRPDIVEDVFTKNAAALLGVK